MKDAIPPVHHSSPNVIATNKTSYQVVEVKCSEDKLGTF